MQDDPLIRDWNRTLTGATNDASFDAAVLNLRVVLLRREGR